MYLSQSKYFTVTIMVIAVHPCISQRGGGDYNIPENIYVDSTIRDVYIWSVLIHTVVALEV